MGSNLIILETLTETQSQSVNLNPGNDQLMS